VYPGDQAEKSEYKAGMTKKRAGNKIKNQQPPAFETGGFVVFIMKNCFSLSFALLLEELLQCQVEFVDAFLQCDRSGAGEVITVFQIAAAAHIEPGHDLVFT